jgi:elongation factor G
MDRVGADFFQVLADIREKLGAVPAAIQIPIGRENGFEGVIDLIDRREAHWSGAEGEELVYSEITPERAELAAEWREKLIDALSAVSDPVTALYIAGEDIPADLLRSELRKAALKRALLPVLAGASRRNLGVQPLIDAVIDYLPAPDEAAPLTAYNTRKDETVEVKRDPKGPPLGLVFKIQHEREAGSLCYVRMYSGKIEGGTAVYNTGKRKRERVNRILRMHSNKFEPMDALTAGDIGVIIGMKLSQTGDTIGSEGFPVVLERMQFPEPVISVSIEPKTASERDKLNEILEILSKEDPTFTKRENDETGQLIISGMGELHLEVLVTRILKEYKVEARVGAPQVTYRESVSAAIERSESFSRVIAGKETAAALTLRVEPLPRGSGNRYSSAVRKGEIPAEIFDAIERGVTGALNSGIVLGYPCIDTGVTLTGIDYSEATGTEAAFEACASICFDEACRDAAPVLLEPVMLVTLVSPSEFTGSVISLVAQRGGHVISMTPNCADSEIKVNAPMAKMFGFMTALRSESQGRATFTMEFSHFEKKPQS